MANISHSQVVGTNQGPIKASLVIKQYSLLHPQRIMHEKMFLIVTLHTTKNKTDVNAG